MAEELLVCTDVCKEFTVRQGLFAEPALVHAVDRVSFSLTRGECVGLVGESGCGKSTLGRLACGLLPPTRGTITLDGKLLPPAGPKSWAAGQIQMVFQDPFSSLNPRMTVQDSVAEPLAAKGMGRKERQASANEMLARVGLEGSGKRYPHEFSGGQRQRIAIARAVITHPSVLICDEAVSALDASVQAQILNLLKDLQEQFSPAVLFISHDLAVVGFMCERILVMYLGRIVEEGPKDDLLTHPAHPYTQALLAARNCHVRDTSPLLEGELPNPLNPPTGCAFHPRCPKALPCCAQETPAWKTRAATWRVRCHAVS